jgi:hypothetical protein
MCEFPYIGASKTTIKYLFKNSGTCKTNEE